MLLNNSTSTSTSNIGASFRTLSRSLPTLSNAELIKNTKILVKDERRINVEILRYLKEIELRKLHLARGYSSLFDYLTGELSYSEDAAYRRIQAMRLLKDVPEVEEKIASGTLSLTAAAKIQKFFKAEGKRKSNSFGDASNVKAQANSESHDFELGFCSTNDPDAQVAKNRPDAQGFNVPQTSQVSPLTQEMKLQLITSLENKSSRAVDKKLVELNPEITVKERVRSIAACKTELRLVIDDKLKEKLDQIKNLLSHKNPNMSYSEVLDYLVGLGLSKLDRTLTAASKSRRNVSGAPKSITTTVRRNIWVKGSGKCQYIDTHSGKKCGSQFQLQVDHIYPKSRGGSNEPGNLQLLCSAHNRFKGARLI